MIFEQIRSAGCLSYVIGCEEGCAGVIVDPELSQIDRYISLAAAKGLHLAYVIDTHTHADHFSAARLLAKRLGVPAVMGRYSPAPFVDVRLDDGESLVVGKLRLRALVTPGHTRDSICLVLPDRVLTGDTLLIKGTGRTDLPSGDPEALHESLFGKLLTLDDALQVFPAHDYKERVSSTLGEEKAENPRLQRRERGAFVAQMRALDLKMPTHLTEALRTNQTGGKTVAELIANAASKVKFMSLEEVRRRIDRGDPDLVLLDVRERDAYLAAHLPGARHIARGQLELRVNEALPDPTVRVLTYCEFGKVSTLAAATLQEMGFTRALALDGGVRSWREAGHPLETGAGAAVQ